MLTREQIVAQLDALEQAMLRKQSLEANLSTLFGCSFFEGAFWEFVDQMEMLSIETLSLCSGLSEEVLYWWIWSAEFGKGSCNGVSAVEGGELVRLTCNAEFIEWELSDVGT